MRSYSGLLILTVWLCGCAVMQVSTGYPSLPALSPESISSLRQTISAISDPLREQLMAELDKESSKYAIPSGAVADSLSLHEALVTMLSHSENALLMPDAQFERLRQAVLGNPQTVRADFAEALARFVTQAQYKCKEPAFYEYFLARYQMPTGVAKCPNHIPFMILSRYENEKPVWLEISRVRAIHVLFAGKSGHLASRFGHVGLRLIVCPNVNSTDRECETNVFEHLVLGFQAQVDDFSIDLWKGLNGSYQTYLFASNFMDAYEEYAIGEFREIYSMPIRISAKDRDRILRGLAEAHWQYSGEYRFLTRNCATALQFLLRALWTDYAGNEALAVTFLRPDHFFEALLESQLGEGDKLEPTDAAESGGYYFPSTEKYYRQALDEVTTNWEWPNISSLDNYIELEPPSRRARIDNDEAYLTELKEKKRLWQAQILLEEYAAVVAERLVMVEGARLIEELDVDRINALLNEAQRIVFDRCLLRPILQRQKPLKIVEGIPERVDVAADQNVEGFCLELENRNRLLEVFTRLNPNKTSDQWQRLNGVAQYWSDTWSNVAYLKGL